MNQRRKFSIAIAVIVALSIYILTFKPREVPVEVPVKVPEFRQPPIKMYKPGHVQQMGVLLGDDGETLPLYGKEVMGRRDRYHYYTTTPGEQIYSLPISHEDRDCMDDMGCRELYGQEKVNIMGKTNPFEAKLYRTNNFFV